MYPGRIRPIAICVLRHKGRILVAEGFDSVEQQVFYRPLGGTIEFGEYSIDTVARELEEELGAVVADLRYLGTLENVFTYQGEQGHEIIQIYDGRFVDKSLYEQPILNALEGSRPIKAVWRSLDAFAQADSPPLYPDGLLAMLSQP